MSRKNNYCFTLNNYSPEEYDYISQFKCKYLIVGKEVGEEGTPHLQGFISFADGKTLNYLKKHLSNRAHFEEAVGTVEQNYLYCTKQQS